MGLNLLESYSLPGGLQLVSTYLVDDDQNGAKNHLYDKKYNFCNFGVISVKQVVYKLINTMVMVIAYLLERNWTFKKYLITFSMLKKCPFAELWLCKISKTRKLLQVKFLLIY